MDGIKLAVKYSYITNKLRYCGPEDSYLKFLEYIKSEDKSLAEEIKSDLKKFEALYPYIELIVKNTSLDVFDYKIMESYWLGNELLEKFDTTDLKGMIMNLVKRGLPRSYAEKMSRNIPKGMVPHHSFNVIYVGVGKVTGSVETNIENINNCLIRPAKVLEVKKDKMIVEHTPYIYDMNRLVSSKPIKDEYDYLPEFTKAKPGEYVSVHWCFVVDKLSKEQKLNLIKYTQRNVGALNNGL